jgi:hypothetical protein
LSKRQDLLKNNSAYLKDPPGDWRASFEELFSSMGFTTTEVTFSGLRKQMWTNTEFGRIYSSLHKVKRRRHIIQREPMIKGTNKMEEGWGYSSGICMLEENKDEESQEKGKKGESKDRARQQSTYEGGSEGV